MITRRGTLARATARRAEFGLHDAALLARARNDGAFRRFRCGRINALGIRGVDGDGDGKADILDQADAVYSAARYLCASGGGQPDTLYDAIYSYNHSDFYVKTVLGLAAQYR